MVSGVVVEVVVVEVVLVVDILLHNTCQLTMAVAKTGGAGAFQPTHPTPSRPCSEEAGQPTPPPPEMPRSAAAVQDTPAQARPGGFGDVQPTPRPPARPGSHGAVQPNPPPTAKLGRAGGGCSLHPHSQAKPNVDKGSQQNTSVTSGKGLALRVGPWCLCTDVAAAGRDCGLRCGLSTQHTHTTLNPRHPELRLNLFLTIGNYGHDNFCVLPVTPPNHQPPLLGHHTEPHHPAPQTNHATAN